MPSGTSSEDPYGLKQSGPSLPRRRTRCGQPITSSSFLSHRPCTSNQAARRRRGRARRRGDSRETRQRGTGGTRKKEEDNDQGNSNNNNHHDDNDNNNNSRKGYRCRKAGTPTSGRKGLGTGSIFVTLSIAYWIDFRPDLTPNLDQCWELFRVYFALKLRSYLEVVWAWIFHRFLFPML